MLVGLGNFSENVGRKVEHVETPNKSECVFLGIVMVDVQSVDIEAGALDHGLFQSLWLLWGHWWLCRQWSHAILFTGSLENVPVADDMLKVSNSVITSTTSPCQPPLIIK